MAPISESEFCGHLVVQSSSPSSAMPTVASWTERSRSTLKHVELNLPGLPDVGWRATLTRTHTRSHRALAFSNARAEVSRELAERCRARGACALARLSVGHVSRVLGACAHLFTVDTSVLSAELHRARQSTHDHTRSRALSHRRA